MVSISVKAQGLDWAIGCDQMCQDDQQCDCGKVHCFILKCFQAFAVDGFKDELFEAFANVVIQMEHGKLGIVDTIELLSWTCVSFA